MPKKVHILVEGPTEERFVRGSFGKYLAGRDIYANPIIIKTKKALSGPSHKGGINSYSQVKKDLIPLLYDTSADIVTTMIDYYALPSDFPGYNERPDGRTCYQRIEFVEEKFNEDINKLKFLPYLQLHEFEALIFASESDFPIAFVNKEKEIQQVNAINQNFNSPEEINENSNTAPSKRLKRIYPEYQKVFHSQLILSQASIDKIRTKCPHFNEWLMKLES